MYNREKYILSDPSIKKDLLRLFKTDQPLTILDIGACEGEDSIKYSRLFPNASVFAFEPLPNNQKIVTENLKKYGAANVNLLPVALSDEVSIEKFYVSSGKPKEVGEDLDWDFGNKSSSLLPPDELSERIPWLEFKEVISVPTDTLKNFLLQHNIDEVDFIHMDVQGAELKVLLGAGSLIEKIKAIWLEVSNVALYKDQPRRTDIEDFMKKNGFYLIKTNLEGETGDQMYLNSRYFKTVSFLFMQKHFHKKR